MAEISQFTGKFRVAGIRKQRGEDTAPIRRQRQTLVCNQCRASKLRCDKARPCSSCLRREGGESCSYDSPRHDSKKPTTEERLNHLEAMVTQLVNAPKTSDLIIGSGTPLRPADDANNSQGVGAPRDKYPTVVEEIVDSIRQLRLELPATDNERDLESSSINNDNMVDECIFGLSSSYSRQSIISKYMPPETEADQLLATYFGGKTFIQPFIHAHNFREQYHAYRTSQFSTASALWLSTLFSIFAIAAMVPGATPDAREWSQKLQTAAGQCLVLGRYHITQRDAPEALLLYAHCKGLRSLDPSRECGAIVCIAVRHAYELGYHRDPDTFGKFTVFEGEMRRRFWACCKQVDTMVSFQLGLPSNIIFDNCNTRSPLNLLDSDFDKNVQILPCPRPESEATPMLWFIVKDRMMPVFAKICQTALSLRLKTEEEVMELDAEVKQAHATIPDVLRWRPVAKCTADPPFLVMCRLFLELLYLKSVCILHRRYMVQGSASSVCQCVESASDIARRVADVHRAFQIGGHLQEVSWMFKGTAMTDFLLGATILCLYVSLDCRGDISQALTSTTTMEVLALLRDARLVCLDRSLHSADARKVALAVQITLRSAEEKASLFGQEASDAEAPDLTSWVDVDVSHFPLLENQFTFSELDPFDFMSGASKDLDPFWGSSAPEVDFNSSL